MIEMARIQEISDQLEIQNVLILYCSAIDSKKYDELDYVFTPNAVIDYTSAGGPRGPFHEIKSWLEKALSLFPMTQHVVHNFDIVVSGDKATSRCVFYNPMGLGLHGGNMQMFFVGGYYNDKLVRTAEGWRITERIEESTWHDGEFPGEIEVPKL